MNFMLLFCGIPFTIVLVLFIISLKNKNIFVELSVSVRFALVLASIVPIWGVILAIFGIIYFTRDYKKLKNKTQEMKNLTIKRGRHRPFSFIPPFLRNLRIDRRRSQIVGYTLRFNENCEYRLDDNDQYDWNKLYGWGLDNHKKDSVRLVWRYNSYRKVIEIAPYVYKSGIRVLPHISNICDIKINERVETSIEVLDNDACVTIRPESGGSFRYTFKFENCSKKVLFGCWFYFGGNRKAPQNITISFSKLENPVAILLRKDD